MLEIKLPDEVMENLPAETSGIVERLSQHFDEVILTYEIRFQKRVQGVMGGPLSRYEKSILKDFLLDTTLGKLRGVEEPSAFPQEEAGVAVMK